MSISSSGTRKSGPYAGNGGTTAFPFAFKVFLASDVLVVQTDTTPADHTLVLNTDYTVTLNPNQDANPGGTINMVVAPPGGYLLTIGSNVPELQSVTLTNNGGFYPTVINTALDYLTILIQQLSEKIGRALVMPFSTNASGQLPPVAPGQLLGWKADGTGIDNVGASGVGAGGIVASNMAAGATGTALSSDTRAANAKAAPADADLVPLFDSANFWYLKGLTWANLKAAIAGFIGMRLDMSGAVNFARSTLASATTIDPWTNTANTIDVSGTAMITGIAAAPQAGATRRLRATGAFSVAAGAALSIDGISSGQTLIVGVGDRLEIEAITTTAFVIHQIRADVSLSTIQTAANDPAFVDNSDKPASTGWIRSAMSTIATAGGFAMQLGQPGYIRLPSWLGGLIIQWGLAGAASVAYLGGANVAITFPISFPNAVFTVQPGPRQGVGGAAVYCSSISLTGATVSYSNLNSGTITIQAWYVSFGY